MSGFEHQPRRNDRGLESSVDGDVRPGPRLDVSVVIVNWNAREYLTRAVASVFADRFSGAVEVVVVDNGSTDGSVDRLQAAEARARIVETGANLGFARACNAGVRTARGGLVLFLNPDAELRPGALAALVSAAAAHPDAGVLGGLVVGRDGVVDPASRRNVPTPAMALRRLLPFPGGARRAGAAAYNVDIALDEGITEVGAVSGSFLMIRRSAFDALGGFDERFFLYAEDLDLCHRARSAGWTVRSVPDAVAVHHKHVSVAQMPYRGLWYFYSTMIRFHSKHYAREYPRIVNVAVYGGIVVLLVTRLVGTAIRRGAPFRLATRPRLGGAQKSEVAR